MATSNVKRMLLGLLFSLGLALSARNCDAQARPDDKLTPGVIRPELETKAVCSTKWGADERAVTEAMKKQVYAEYHTAPGEGICKLVAHKGKKGQLVKKGCEIDHRVSRELAGADDVRNLWPQPYLTPSDLGAYAKDKLENALHRKVCAGQITLKQAQDALLGDWIVAYKKEFGP